MSSSKYAMVKSLYDKGLWKINRVHDAVEMHWITAEEFEEITGVPYEEA